MVRKIKSPLSDLSLSLEKSSDLSASGILKLSLSNGPFGNLKPFVSAGDKVRKNSLLAGADQLSLNAPAAGIIKTVENDHLIISLLNEEEQDDRSCSEEAFGEFLSKIGLCGMGGSGFPASVKFDSGRGKVRNLIINCVECEPGVTIDRAVLINEHEIVKKGALALQKALGAAEVFIAILKDRVFREKAEKLYSDFKIIEVGKGYPAGAERLIIRSVTKKDLSQGVLPFEEGFHIQNTVSVYSLGTALKSNRPITLRPLSLIIPAEKRNFNIIVPNGTIIQDLVEKYTAAYSGDDIIIAGGLMMGKRVSLSDSISLATTSLWVLNKDKVKSTYRSCIKCGACYDACPLDLHPSMVFDLIFHERDQSSALDVQVRECFLCGSCAAVCPADIPLVEAFREGKKWLKK